VSKVRSLTELCGLRVSMESYVPPKGPSASASAASALDTRSVTGYAPWSVACGGSHLSGGCCIPREQPQCCGCVGNNTTNYRGCIKWQEAKSALCKASARACPKDLRHRPPCHPEISAGRALCRADGPGRGVESRRPRGACCQGHRHSTPNPKPLSSAGHGGARTAYIDLH
jgi:hypothetical protein